MNEVVGTLYFVLASNRLEEWARHSEADTFFCFTSLMSEVRDLFIQRLDETASGIEVNAFLSLNSSRTSCLIPISEGCVFFFIRGKSPNWSAW